MTFFEILGKLDNLLGPSGVILGLLVFILMQISWVYFRSLSRKKAESFFNQSLAKHQSQLLSKVGQKFIKQRGDIDKEISANQTKLISTISKQFIEQKRDIDREITKLKGEIEKDISHLQSDLNLITSQKIAYWNHKREAIIDYYSSYAHWVNTILDHPPIGNVDELINNLEQPYLNNVNETKLKYKFAEAKLELYFNEDSFMNVKGALNVETVKIQNNIQDRISYTKTKYLFGKSKHNFDQSHAIDEKVIQQYQDDMLELRKSSRVIQMRVRDALSKALIEITNELDKNIYSPDSQTQI